jgi:hypothetical protein
LHQGQRLMSDVDITQLIREAGQHQEGGDGHDIAGGCISE